MKTKPVQSVAEFRGGPVEAFAPLAEQFGSIWLDSSMQANGMGTQSLIASRPSMDISQVNGRISITGRGPTAGWVPHFSSGFPSDGAGSILEVVQTLCQEQGLTAIGYITFEAALPWLGLNQAGKSFLIPEARFLLYDSVRRFDHNSTGQCVKGNDESTGTWRMSQKPLPCERQASVPADLDEKHEKIGRGGTVPPIEQWLADPMRQLPWDEPPGLPPVAVRPSLSKKDYLARVRTIKQYIKEGDIYQANFTTRFEVSSTDKPFKVYQNLRHYNPAPYAAYLNFGDYHILSSSPERMFLWQNDMITTCPIKGTIKRGTNDLEDSLKLKSLLESEKDRAELLMIVDLERNDLGKLARPGTVRVDDLFEPLQYSSVFHLAANVSATLRPDVSISDVIKALLPGGSISGAPKKRAVQIIRRLETVPRMVYTGCIGYIDRQTADFNIAIRTMLHRNGCYHIHAGGGIVADSDPEEEYLEMLLKALNLFRALGADPEKIAQ